MYLVNNFGPLVLLSSLLTFSLVTVFIPPVMADIAEPVGFSCSEEKSTNGLISIKKSECREPNSVCWINVETGKGLAKCQPESTDQCFQHPLPHDGSIHCSPGTKHCCCIDTDTNTICNDHTNPAIKAKICAVPELKKSELCCEVEGGCTSTTGPGGSSSAVILSGFSGFITGTVGILAVVIW